MLDLTRLKNRVLGYPPYAYYFFLEKLNRKWSIERTRFEVCDVNGVVKDCSNSVELFLFRDHNRINEFEQSTEERSKLVSNIPDKLRTETCFVCGSRLIPIVQVINYDDHRDYIEYSWCQHCDHSQYSVLPSKEWITNWYLTNWDTSRTLDQNLELRKPTYRYYNRLKKYIGARKLKVLDIGAGYGEKILPFKEHGHEVYCTEATPRRADYLRRNVTPNVFLGAFDDPGVQAQLIRQGPYDLIFSYHVIEHIYNPTMELQLLKQIASKDAIFYLAIPEFYKEGILNNIYSMEHIESFSRNSGKYLLKQLGFETICAEDDLFQYYSNYCQYFVGRKTENPDSIRVETGFNRQKLIDYLREVFHLDQIQGMSGNAFNCTYFKHAPLTYLVSDDTKRKCQQLESHLPIRIYHKGLPLFWMVS